MVKRFMYGSITILALALALHLRSIAANSSPDCVEAVMFSGPSNFMVVVSGTVQVWNSGGLYEQYPALPSGSGVAGLHVDQTGFPIVLLRDGRLYRWGPSPSWELVRDICGTTTVSPTTWGQVKHGARK